MAPPNSASQASAARQAINLRTLQRIDPTILSILEWASYVVLYTYVGGKWAKEGIEGSLFVYQRSISPQHGFLILNRNGMNNFIRPILTTTDLDVQGQFIHTSGEGMPRQEEVNTDAVHGLWFHAGEEEAERIMEKMQELKTLAGAAQPDGGTSGGGEAGGIMSMTALLGKLSAGIKPLPTSSSSPSISSNPSSSHLPSQHTNNASTAVPSSSTALDPESASSALKSLLGLSSITQSVLSAPHLSQTVPAPEESTRTLQLGSTPARNVASPLDKLFLGVSNSLSAVEKLSSSEGSAVAEGSILTPPAGNIVPVFGLPDGTSLAGHGSANLSGQLQQQPQYHGLPSLIPMSSSSQPPPHPSQSLGSPQSLRQVPEGPPPPSLGQQQIQGGPMFFPPPPHMPLGMGGPIPMQVMNGYPAQHQAFGFPPMGGPMGGVGMPMQIGPGIGSAPGPIPYPPPFPPQVQMGMQQSQQLPPPQPRGPIQGPASPMQQRPPAQRPPFSPPNHQNRNQRPPPPGRGGMRQAPARPPPTAPSVPDADNLSAFPFLPAVLSTKSPTPKNQKQVGGIDSIIVNGAAGTKESSTSDSGKKAVLDKELIRRTLHKSLAGSSNGTTGGNKQDAEMKERDKQEFKNLVREVWKEDEDGLSGLLWEAMLLESRP